MFSKNLSIRLWATLLALCSGFTAVNINATTIATWADPGSLSFTFVDTGTDSDGQGDLTAANTQISLDLPVLGLTGIDASYALTDLSGGALSTTSQTDNGLGFVEAVYEAGKVVITSDINQGMFTAGQTLLTITFDSAIGILGNVLANDDLIGMNVSFSGVALGGLTAAGSEQFQFSSANLTCTGGGSSCALIPADMEAWTATTAFTSSAVLVPVPPAVWLFGSGLLGLVGIARRKKTT